MLDPKYDDFVGHLVDAVEDAVAAPSSGVDPGELASQLLSHPMRVVNERPGEELDDRSSDRLWQLPL